MEIEINSAIVSALDGDTAHPRNACHKTKGRKQKKKREWCSYDRGSRKEDAGLH